MTRMLEHPQVVRAERGGRELANADMMRFVHRALRVCEPDQIYWANGSAYEREKLLAGAIAEGALVPAGAAGHPDWYVDRNLAEKQWRRREKARSFVCTPEQHSAAGSNWMKAGEAYARLEELFKASMRGRTMYVVPFVIGPIVSPTAKVGLQLTDSIQAVLTMGQLASTGDAALRVLGEGEEFARCLHSSGDGNADQRYLCHFPFDNTVLSFGGENPGNAVTEGCRWETIPLIFRGEVK